MKFEMEQLLGFIVGFDIYTTVGIIVVTNRRLAFSVRKCPNIKRICLYCGCFYIHCYF